MNNKAVKIFLSVILAIVLVSGIAVLINNVNKDDASVPVAATTEAPTENKTEPVTEKKTASVSFLSVGDNLIHDGIYEQANKRAGGSNYDFSYCYKNIASSVSSVDIATINQETIISKSNQPSGYPLFNSPEQVGDELVNIGFDVINMANNHMLDKNTKGLTEAIEYWNSKQGVVKTGAYLNQSDLDNVEYIEKNGLKIGLVGVTQYTNGLSLPSGSELKIIYTSDEATIEKKIKAAKEQCDMVLVNVHWGNEYTTVPTDSQRQLAVKMAGWGANVIIGHHPHVIEPVEWIDNKDGTRTLVAFSLGNFISQQATPARVIGGMLHYSVTKDFNTNSVTVTDVTFEPIITQYVRGKYDVQIIPLSQYTDALAKQQASRLEETSFSVSYINDFVGKVIDAQFLAS